MYNYQNTRIETKKGQFKPPSSRMVQVLRKKDQQEDSVNAPDVVTLHRSIQRVIVKEIGKQPLFEKTKFLPNQCDDQYYTAIDPIELEDYSKIYNNIQAILQMDPIKIKKAREIAETERQEKEKQKALFEQQIKQYKFQRKNIVKQRMQSILDKHNKHQNNHHSNNNVPQKEEINLKPHDQKVLSNLNDMYTKVPQSVKNATSMSKVSSNLSSFEKTKNTLISQTKVPYQQIIRMSNNSVLNARHKKRSNTINVESHSNQNQEDKQFNQQFDQKQQIQPQPNIIENQQQNQVEDHQIRIMTLSNSIETNNSDIYGQVARRHSTTAPALSPRVKRFQAKDQIPQDSDNQTYYNPAHTTLQSTQNQSRIKQLNQTVSPDYYSTSQRWLGNNSSADQLKIRNSHSFSRFQKFSTIKRDSSKSSNVSQDRYTSQNQMVAQLSQKNIDGLYLTQCLQKTENDENDQNLINKLNQERISFSIDPFGTSLRQNTQNTKQPTQQTNDKQVFKKEQKKQRNPMKQYYDVDADQNKEKDRIEYSLDVPFDQFYRKFNISLNSGEPRKTLIQLPSLENELKLKGLKRQQEEQQKRQKMNLSLNQLEEFKGFKFPLNDSQVMPIKTSHHGRINQGTNCNSMNIINGTQSMIGQYPNTNTNSRKNTFNLFYKGQTSIILQQKERKKSPSTQFQNLNRSNSKENSGLMKQTSILLQNNNISSPSPPKGNHQLQQLSLSMNIQDFNKSELLIPPQGQFSKKQSKIQDQHLNISINSGIKLKLNESPLVTGRTKSNDNTSKGPKQSILLKRDQNSRQNNFQNQVSFVLSDSPIISQNYLNERISPIKTANQDSRMNISQNINNDMKSQSNTSQDQYLMKKQINNYTNQSNIIYENPDMQAQSTRNSKTKFFDKNINQVIKKNEGQKTEEMIINENQKNIEKMKSIKFKKLVNRTHQCEDRVIDGCRSFYVKKKEKNQELFQLFLTHYRDRPKTQEIRSRNYSCNSSGSSRFNLKVAREQSENDRIQLSKINEPQQNIYRQLITKLIMKSNSGDNMNICIYVMNAFKTVLEDLEFFQSHHFFQLLQNIEENDTYFYNPTSYFMVTSLLDHLALPFHEITKYKKLSQFITYFQNLETEQQKTQQTIIPDNKQKKTSDIFQMTSQNEETIEDFEDNID